MLQIEKLNTKQKIFILALGVSLPMLSFYLASKASLFYENLTYVGNLASNRTLFIIWGILQSLFYGASYFYIIQKFNTQNKRLRLLCIFITSMSIIAFLLPYQNHSADILSQLHVYGSMLSCIFSFVLLIQQIIAFATHDLYLFTQAKKGLFMVVSSFAFLILLFGDISSMSELFLLNGLNYLFLYLILYPIHVS